MAITEEVRQTSENSIMEVDYSDYKFAQPRIKKLIDDWELIKKETERLRALRYLRVDEKALKNDGKLLENQKYIAARLIDANIRAEQPQHISYLTKSRRAVVLKPISGVNVDGVGRLENEVTKAFRYIGWQSPFLRVIDGCEHHGWDAVELVLDTSKPCHTAEEHIGHENLIFDREAEDLQNQELIIRRVKLTSIQLRINIKQFGFNESQVGEILASKDGESESQTKDIQYDVYKVYYRDLNNHINIAWYHEKCSGAWLKNPEPFYLGMNDLEATPVTDELGNVTQDRPKLPETEFPFYLLPYYESENAAISELRGRGFLDEPAQEGASALLSAVVNGNVAASIPYGAVKTNNPGDTDTADIKQIKTQLKPGAIYDKAIEFFHHEYPPASAMHAFSMLTSSNKAETAKVDHAAINKKDSRQTAAAVNAAREEGAELTSVQVTLLSIFTQLVYGRKFRIYQNRVKQGKIKIEDEKLVQLFDHEYHVESSGDVDVLQRKEKLAMMMQMWPVFQKTAIAMPFLKNIIRTAFPEDADAYIIELDKATDPAALITALTAQLSAVVPEVQNQLPPQQIMQIQQTLMQSKQFLATVGQDEPVNELEQDNRESQQAQPQAA